MRWRLDGKEVRGQEGVKEGAGGWKRSEEVWEDGKVREDGKEMRRGNGKEVRGRGLDLGGGGGWLCTFLETEISCVQRFVVTPEHIIATGHTINNTSVVELLRLIAVSKEMPFLPFSNCSHALVI